MNADHRLVNLLLIIPGTAVDVGDAFIFLEAGDKTGPKTVKWV
jgi:hypothetical protein